MLDKAVSDYLQASRQRHLNELFDLLRIPSIANPSRQYAGGCEKAADYLVRKLRDIGLTADIMPTAGKPCVFAHMQIDSQLPTLLIYGHYDVQPPEPLELWQSGPFQPQVRDDCIYARGANDDKGQLFAHIMALEAWKEATGTFPVNVKILLEGEEEIGSPNLEEFISEHSSLLEADAAVISDSEFFAANAPSITCALRGLVYCEITVTGPAADCHSGSHGGALANPINALAAIIAAMHDDAGKVAIGGFYDDVLNLTDDERAQWNALPFDEAAYAASLGVDALAGGEDGYSVLERRWARPTLDCNGIIGGYTAAGSKTIIPATASVKLSARLVSDQDPRKIAAAIERFVHDHTPAGLKAKVTIAAEARPVMLSRKSPAVAAACLAVAEAFGKEPVFIRCGASVPVTEIIQRLLGVDAVMMGFGLPDDNLHAPNERFRLGQLWAGSHAAAAFMQNLARK